MASKPLLGYWDIRGVAEPIRYMLAYVGIDFDEKLYANRNHWLSEKFTLGLEFPNLPYYFDGDVRLTQSMAIMQHIARRHSLDGATELERDKISLVERQVYDQFWRIGRIAYDENCDKLKVDYLKTVPDQVAPLAAYLGDDNPFVAGANLSYVDFWLYEFLKKIAAMVPGSLDSYPNLNRFIERIESLPPIAQYIRAHSPKHFHNPSARWNAQA